MGVNKRRFGIAIIFSTTIFVIIIITFILAGAIGFVLMQTGLIDGRYPILFLGILCVSCLLAGLIFSKITSKTIFSSFFRINEATRHISSGNYNIRLREDSHVIEINEISHNFNVMAKALASTEILQHNFVENVSHEFKTPLTAIEGYATVLQNAELSDEKRDEYLKRIVESTKRLSTLAGNILILSKLENQEIGLQKESFNLSEQIREEILILESQWAKKNITLEIDLEEIDITGNEELLAHVWQNILGNAIKFSKEDSIIKIALSKSEDFVSVIIKDQGIGMEKETLKRAFDKFYQEDTSRATTGNGLGLALVKRIIDLHNGKIEIDSKLNEGTEIKIVLINNKERN